MKEKLIEKPYISVIVPIYNNERYLALCIESLLNQTCKNIEIILVDDGSTDDSSRICENYAKKDIRVIVAHKANGGVSAARNMGLAIAQGQFVAFVDSDDIVAPCMYENLYNKALLHNADTVWCDIKSFTGELDLIPNDSTVNFEIVLKGIEEIYEFSGYRATQYSSMTFDSVVNKIYARELAMGITFDETMVCGEDGIFNLQYLEKSQRWVAIGNHYYYYRTDNPQSSTRNINIKKLKDARTYYKKRLDICYERNMRKEIIYKENADYEVQLVTEYVYLCLLDKKYTAWKKNVSEEFRKKFSPRLFYYVSAKWKAMLLLFYICPHFMGIVGSLYIKRGNPDGFIKYD